MAENAPPIIIFGGKHHGALVEHPAVDVMQSRGPRALYDPTGESRPFCDDYVRRTLVAQRMGITISVIVDGVPEAAVLDVLTRAVHEAFARIATEERPRG